MGFSNWCKYGTALFLGVATTALSETLSRTTDKNLYAAVAGSDNDPGIGIHIGLNAGLLLGPIVLLIGSQLFIKCIQSTCSPCANFCADVNETQRNTSFVGALLAVICCEGSSAKDAKDERQNERDLAAKQAARGDKGSRPAYLTRHVKHIDKHEEEDEEVGHLRPTDRHEEEERKTLLEK